VCELARHGRLHRVVTARRDTRLRFVHLGLKVYAAKSRFGGAAKRGVRLAKTCNQAVSAREPPPQNQRVTKLPGQDSNLEKQDQNLL
jgi:hypothetical protein